MQRTTKEKLVKRSMQLAVLVLSVGAAGGLLASGGVGKEGKLLPQASNEKWLAECGSCHMAYQPGLLPARSWRQVVAGLDEHFGENASLDPATAEEIAGFLAAHAADRNGNRRSAKIAASIPPGAAPLRVSETAYFRRKHHGHDGDLGPELWRRPKVGSPANCPACHTTAEQGDYSERNVRIPR